MSPAGAFELAPPRRRAAEISLSAGRSGPRRGFPAPARAAVIAFAAAALLFGRPASADDTFVVDSFADLVDSDPVDIQCQTVAGTCTLRAAVMQANLNPGDTTILLPPGLFNLSRLPSGGNGADNGDLNLAKDSAVGTITIRGAGAAATIVDGGDLDRIFSVEPGAEASIEELTVRNGTAYIGGGILVRGALSLTAARITENIASLDGGGLYIDTSSFVQIHFSKVVANQGSLGGGIYLSAAAQGNFHFTYGEIRDNVADFGGGLNHQGTGWIKLLHTSVSGNEAAMGGGVMSGDSTATVVVESSTIDGNRATVASFGSGGGILNSSTLLLVNSTISGNTAAGDGGGIHNYGVASLLNSTLTFNEADSDADPNGGLGGGVRNSPPGIFAIRNSVLAGNYRSGSPIEDDCYGILGAYGHNRFGSFTGCSIAHTGGCGGSDLLLASLSELGPLRYNGGVTPTHAIQPGSSLIDDVDAPCICQNQFAGEMSLDQRDGSRIAGERCDVGAYEFDALPSNLIFTDGFGWGNAGLWD